MHNPPDRCPLMMAAANQGGTIEASVGANSLQQLTVTFSATSGVGSLNAACALETLAARAVQQPNLDATQCCRRCTRTVRLQSKI